MTFTKAFVTGDKFSGIKATPNLKPPAENNFEIPVVIIVPSG